MQPREAAWSLTNDTPTLPAPGWPAHCSAAATRSATPVRNAFAQVPRHVFVPEVGAAAAYRDEALVIKSAPTGCRSARRRSPR